jgi:hypothetical protein
VEPIAIVATNGAPLTSNQGTQSLFPDTIKFQWNLEDLGLLIRCARKADQERRKAAKRLMA